MRTLMVILATMAITTMAGANYVQNGDFTQGSNPDGLSSWSAAGDITLVNEADQASDTVWVRDSFWGGAWSDVLVIQSSGAGGNGEGVMQYLPIGNDPEYTLSFKFGFTNIGSYSTVSLSYRDAAGDPISGAGYYQTAFDWTDAGPSTNVAYNNHSSGLNDFSVTLTRGAPVSGNSTIIPTTAAYMYISLKQHYAGYQTYFDDISLVPEPATIAVLGIGGLFLSRRRK